MGAEAANTLLAASDKFGEPPNVCVPSVAVSGRFAVSELAVVETLTSPLMLVLCSSVSVILPFASASGLTRAHRRRRIQIDIPPTTCTSSNPTFAGVLKLGTSTAALSVSELTRTKNASPALTPGLRSKPNVKLKCRFAASGTLAAESSVSPARDAFAPRFGSHAARPSSIQSQIELQLIAQGRAEVARLSRWPDLPLTVRPPAEPLKPLSVATSASVVAAGVAESLETSWLSRMLRMPSRWPIELSISETGCSQPIECR